MGHAKLVAARVHALQILHSSVRMRLLMTSQLKIWSICLCHTSLQRSKVGLAPPRGMNAWRAYAKARYVFPATLSLTYLILEKTYSYALGSKDSASLYQT